MKAYTDLEQSKKLAEILHVGSADMFFICVGDREIIRVNDNIKGYNNWDTYPAWSLAALLNVLPYPQLSKDKLGGGKVGWMVSVYPDNCRYDSCWHENPIDACYEIIIKLHEQQLL